MLVGILAGVVFCCFRRLPLWTGLLMTVPMTVDGTVQRLTHYESNNPLRFVTGSICGFGFIIFEVALHIAAFHLGYNTFA